MYAVNAADLTLADNAILAMFLIAPVCQNRTLVDAEPKRIDGMAVLLECGDERAEAIVHTVRLKRQKHELRIYQSKTGKNWKRV